MLTLKSDFSAGVVSVSLYIGGVGGGTVTGSSDERGDFSFDGVPAGLGQITIEALGSDDFATASFDVPVAGEVQLSLALNGIGALACLPEPFPAGLSVLTGLLIAGLGLALWLGGSQ